MEVKMKCTVVPLHNTNSRVVVTRGVSNPKLPFEEEVDVFDLYTEVHLPEHCDALVGLIQTLCHLPDVNIDSRCIALAKKHNILMSVDMNPGCVEIGRRTLNLLPSARRQLQELFKISTHKPSIDTDDEDFIPSR
jgi:hypothetical protein